MPFRNLSILNSKASNESLRIIITKSFWYIAMSSEFPPCFWSQNLRPHTIEVAPPPESELNGKSDMHTFNLGSVS